MYDVTANDGWGHVKGLGHQVNPLKPTSSKTKLDKK